MSPANYPNPQETHPRPRPALRLIKTNDLPRDDWLKVRKRGIGSSDLSLIHI